MKRLLIGLLLVSPGALADGEVEVRGFSISGSQTVLDVFSVGLKYQSPSGESDSYTPDLNADSAQQRFAARYHGGRTNLQGQLTRQSDQDAGTSTTSATFSYAYSPGQVTDLTPPFSAGAP